MPESVNAEISITTDKHRMNLEVIHSYLTRSYWSPGISREIVKKAMQHSLCFGIFADNSQIGFARLVTDYTTFAYLADVFILETHQGMGLGKQLMDYILDYPEVQGLRRWMLRTRDAHTLYEKYGFALLAQPEYVMEK